MRSIKIAKVNRQPSLAEQAYFELKRQIMYNQLPAGHVLNERSISEALGISRTPVRDAFTMLENQGWIMRQGTNKIVRPFTLKDLREIIEIRLDIEEIILKLAFENFNNKNLQHFHIIISEMQAASEEEDNGLLFVEKDINFHLYLAELSQNESLTKFFNTLCEKLIRSAVISLEQGHVVIDTRIKEHEEMLAAFERRNYQEAKALLHKHIEYWHESLTDSFHFVYIK